MLPSAVVHSKRNPCPCVCTYASTLWEGSVMTPWGNSPESYFSTHIWWVFSVCALQCYCLAKPTFSSSVSMTPGLHAACVISLARHPAACQGKTHCQNSFHQVSYPSSPSFFPLCSLSQNLTYINSWKSSSSRVGSVSFHQQFNLLCWQTESTCTQGPRKNRHFLPQSATNEFTEQYTKQCSVTNHQPTCWNPYWCRINPAAGLWSKASFTCPS